MPGLDREGKNRCRRAFIRPSAVATAPTRAGPRWRTPLNDHVRVLREVSSALSLSVEEGRSTFGIMVESVPNFKGLRKVSGVTTNHWVFSGVIGHLFLFDFITNPRLRKMAFFLI